jgi:hypothetical protein
MKTTISYLDDAKEKLGIKSDYGMAKWMSLSRNALSQYRLGKSIIDDYAAAKIASVLEIDPMVLIAAANAEREKDKERQEFWQNFYERLGGVAASIIFCINFIVTPTPSEATPMLKAQKNNMYIMLNKGGK